MARAIQASFLGPFMMSNVSEGLWRLLDIGVQVAIIVAEGFFARDNYSFRSLSFWNLAEDVFDRNFLKMFWSEEIISGGKLSWIVDESMGCHS